jgi:uncharacterized protein YndB with AHSA1/START domain
MTDASEAELDLMISRTINAPRQRVWEAWTDPAQFEKWWVPAPAVCHVEAMELRPGGAFETTISENGGDFVPHMSGCFLAVDQSERIVFTTALVAGWRPAEQPFITAVITLQEDPEGTRYVAHVMHKNNADRMLHEELGFYDGWGTVIGQLATLVEAAR